MFRLGQHRVGAVQGGARRQVEGGEHNPLVFIRHQASGQGLQKFTRGQINHQQQDEGQGQAAHEELHALDVAFGGMGEEPIEAPGQDSHGSADIFFGTQNFDAEGWSEGQGHQDREDRGKAEGEGELTVKLAGDATQKDHRDVD